MLSTYSIIYIGHFLSSWGDRMWYFAIPLFLLDLDPQSLTLSALYGLTVSSSVLLFGPLIGDWIDRKPRLYCVRITLFIQNSAVILCATILLVAQQLGDRESSYMIIVNIGVIFLGAISQLASVGTSIMIQKDWIVVVAGKNKEILADLNSMTRRIDLVTKILSPVACGQIMALATLSGGAIFIMSWNAISMILEYFLLRAVYNRTPALSKKDVPAKNELKDEELQELHNIEKKQFSPDEAKSPQSSAVVVEENPFNDKAEYSKNKNLESKEITINQKQPLWKKMFGFILTLKNGWKLYIAQPIMLPCIGFSLLYMTILGFGYITTAYAYSQCLSELTVGLLQAGAAITGIVATYIFPPMRKSFGLVKTGLFNAVFQSLTLIPCIASVFLIGSPFYLLPENKDTFENTSTTIFHQTIYNSSDMPLVSYDITTNMTNSNEFNSTEDFNLFIKCLEGVELPSSFLSMAFLMTGIIFARVGLWGFDLTITQMIQEHVVEKERGIFNGVQTSLNNLMDLLIFVFVLLLPLPNQFGILIFISSVFVLSGYMLYFIFARKKFSKF